MNTSSLLRNLPINILDSVYLDKENLYESNNIPKPGSFDTNILNGNDINEMELKLISTIRMIKIKEIM